LRVVLLLTEGTKVRAMRAEMEMARGWVLQT
jgi:hypothetical protein